LVDTTTFLIIVTAMGGAIAALAGLLYKTLLAKGECEQKLAGYEANAPELINAFREWTAALESGSGKSFPDGGLKERSLPTRPIPSSKSRKRPTQ
jgi:hypothetical protein